jgi:hypothetical protein
MNLQKYYLKMNSSSQNFIFKIKSLSGNFILQKSIYSSQMSKSPQTMIDNLIE